MKYTKIEKIEIEKVVVRLADREITHKGVIDVLSEPPGWIIIEFKVGDRILYNKDRIDTIEVFTADQVEA